MILHNVMIVVNTHCVMHDIVVTSAEFRTAAGYEWLEIRGHIEGTDTPVEMCISDNEPYRWEGVIGKPVEDYNSRQSESKTPGQS